MSIPMPDGQKFKLLAALKLCALPAAIDALLPAAIPNLTIWRAAVIAASVLATQLYQSAKHFIACRIAFKDIKERSLGKSLSRFIESSLPKLFSEIACQIGNFSSVDEAVAAI